MLSLNIQLQETMAYNAPAHQITQTGTWCHNVAGETLVKTNDVRTVGKILPVSLVFGRFLLSVSMSHY